MTPEIAKSPSIDVLTIKEEILAHKLYVEGKYYREHFREQAIRVGTHLSFFVHEIDGEKILSIHFREGMEELNKLVDKPTTMMKTFLRNLSSDLRLLAEMLSNPNGHPELAEIQSIAGLTHLGATWGEKHGFTTQGWSNNPNLIKPFVKSVGVDTDKSEEEGLVLTLFKHKRETFIQEFLHKRRREARKS